MPGERGRELDAGASEEDAQDDMVEKRRRIEEETSSSSSPQRSSPQVPFSLAALEAEIQAVRSNPPTYVSQVGQLVVPSAVCNQDGKVGKPEGEGPWDLTVRVCGSEGDKAYGHPFRVRLRFDKELWPNHLPIVRFQCVFHHALTEDGERAVVVKVKDGRKTQLSSNGGMMTPFYETLPKDDRGACTVSLTLRAIHDFLVDPLVAWNLDGKEMAAKLQPVVKANAEMNAERFAVIDKYRAMARHPELFAVPPPWKEEWFHPDFWRASQANSPEIWRALLKEHLPGEVFSFPIFSQTFCQVLVEEIFSFYSSGLTARRPNSMNNYGIILNEIGLEAFIDRLQSALQPLGDLLWPGPGSVWDGHHCFIVRYREGEDLGLDMHTDDSDVTFNICLGVEFQGAGLQFCGHMGAPNHRKHTYTYKHVKGTCVCHLGRKRHGADDIHSGERLNLILWNHSSTYRQSDEYKRPPYHTEEGAPDTVCVSYTHDRDFGNFREYPVGKEQFKGRGWCPRPTFEYQEFKPDSEKEIEGS